MKPYGKEIAKKIIDSRIDEFNVKKKGVFPKDDRPSSESEFDFCTWRPACELGKQAGGELRKKPGLPIPFDANELAAFFLHGWGWYVRDSFGSWDDGPDDAAFDKIDSLERDEVKDAVNGAFHAYREAVNILGHFDNSLVVEAQELEDALWNADASLSKAELSESLRIAQEKANDAESEWRKKMVNQLLAVEQVPIEATDEPAGDRPALLTTVLHSTKTRRDALTPVIELAQRQCRNPADTADVWAVLQVLAENKTAPLIGATEDGLQYLKNGTAANFNRDALRKRLRR